MPDMYKTISGLLSDESLSEIKPDAIRDAEIEGLSDDVTMCMYIPLPESVQKAYRSWSTDTYKKDVDTSSVWCEYWIDDDTCHYVFFNNGDSIAATDVFSCDYLDNMVRDKYQHQYKGE
jgi:hypothetical protein